MYLAFFDIGVAVSDMILPSGLPPNIKCMVSDSMLCRTENLYPFLKLFFFRN